MYLIPDAILLHLAWTNVPYGLLLDPAPAEGKACLIDTWKYQVVPLGWLRLKMLLANGNRHVIFIPLFNRKKTFLHWAIDIKVFSSKGIKLSSFDLLYYTSNWERVSNQPFSSERNLEMEINSHLWPPDIKIKCFLYRTNPLATTGLWNICEGYPHPRYTRSSTFCHHRWWKFKETLKNEPMIEIWRKVHSNIHFYIPSPKPQWHVPTYFLWSPQD